MLGAIFAKLPVVALTEQKLSKQCYYIKFPRNNQGDESPPSRENKNRGFLATAKEKSLQNCVMIITFSNKAKLFFSLETFTAVTPKLPTLK